MNDVCFHALIDRMDNILSPSDFLAFQIWFLFRLSCGLLSPFSVHVYWRGTRTRHQNDIHQAIFATTGRGKV